MSERSYEVSARVRCTKGLNHTHWHWQCTWIIGEENRVAHKATTKTVTTIIIILRVARKKIAGSRGYIVNRIQGTASIANQVKRIFTMQRNHVDKTIL